MIYIAPEQLPKVEYLLQKSSQGIHLLFDAGQIREAFSSSEQDEATLYAAEPHLERLLIEPHPSQKQEYFAGLPPETRAAVIRLYFNVVENNLYETRASSH